MADILKQNDQKIVTGEEDPLITIDGIYLDFIYMLKYIAMDDDIAVLTTAPGSKIKKAIDDYCSLKPSCQKLYLRMFLRTPRWFRLAKKNNEYLARNHLLLTELVNAGLCKDESDLEFVDAVGLLYAKEKEKLMVEMKLKHTYKKLEDISKTVGKRSITQFFGQKSTAPSIQQTVLKKIKLIIGQCFALNIDYVKLFEDLFIYFSSKAHISHNFTSRKSNQLSLKTLAQNTLYSLYKIRTNVLVLPTYSINYPSVFNNNCTSVNKNKNNNNNTSVNNDYTSVNNNNNGRNCLVTNEIQFSAYCLWGRRYYDFFELVDSKNKPEAINKYYNLINDNLNPLLELSNIIDDITFIDNNIDNIEEICKCLLERPIDLMTNENATFRPNLSPERFIVKIASEMTEILDSTQQLERSLLITCKLLLQQRYYKRKRGHWWNRLALNMEKRKNDFTMTIQIINKGLNDPYTSKPEFYLLAKRADRLFRSKRWNQLYDNKPTTFADIKHKCCDYLQSFATIPSINLKTKELPTYLTTSLASNNNKTASTRGKYLKYNKENDSEHPSVEIVSVESFALHHYCSNEKFEFGIHAEGSPYISIWGLLFWEIIFCNDVKGVFISPFQYFPLDLFTNQFYQNRKQLIDSRLDWIENCESTELFTSILNTWTKNYGVTQPFVNWEIFDDSKIPMDIVDSLSRKLLTGICKIFSTDYKCRTSGLPDLLLWNTMKKTHKISEVKSTNDKLSHKQIIWIDELIKLGANVEICNVNKQ